MSNQAVRCSATVGSDVIVLLSRLGFHSVAHLDVRPKRDGGTSIGGRLSLDRSPHRGPPPRREQVQLGSDPPAGWFELDAQEWARTEWSYRFRRLGFGLSGPLSVVSDSSSRNEKQPPSFQPPVSMKWTLPSTFG